MQLRVQMKSAEIAEWMTVIQGHGRWRAQGKKVQKKLSREKNGGAAQGR